MRLYLASYRLPSPPELIRLIGKDPSLVRLALIPNARDYKDAEEYRLGMAEVTTYITQLGLAAEVVDLRNYSGGPSLQEKLSGYDGLWFLGGNTFLLRYQIERSGLAGILPALLQDSVYIGESAGAIVAGKSLKGVEACDDASVAPEIIWDGLNIIDKMIIPHADSPDFASGVQRLMDMYPEGDRIVLNDNQVYIVDGDSARLLEG